MGRPLRSLLVVLVVVQVVLPVFLVLARNRLLFFPWRTPLPEAQLDAFRGLDARVVRVRRPDGRELAAYDVAPRDLPADAPVVLFLHGNAGNIGIRAEIARDYARLARVRLLLPDYSGYGGNAGSPSEEEIAADALAAYDHLAAEGVPGSRIVVHGESIGGAPALVVATERRVAGVVVQATFSSLSSIALRVYRWLPLTSILVRGSFPNDERAARLAVPFVVAHGTEDRTIPISEGRRLHAAAPPGAEFLPIPGADHNDFFDVAGEAYLVGLGDRFRRWTAR